MHFFKPRGDQDRFEFADWILNARKNRVDSRPSRARNRGDGSSGVGFAGQRCTGSRGIRYRVSVKTLGTVVFAIMSLNVWEASRASAGDLAFRKHVISDQTDYSAAALIDVNHDGQIDIVCGGDWYEGPTWKKHFVAEIPRIGGRPDGFSHLEFDVNRDGWTDIITVNYRSRSIKWMEHPGESLGPWTTHVAVEPGPMETGRLVDIDGDGQLDLLPNGARFAAWWEFRWDKKSGPGEPAWIRHELPDEAGGHGLGFGDLDGDGHGDIVGQFGWLKAPLDARNGKWEWNPEFALERASIPMIVADVDEDGDNDIVWCSAHGFGVYWLEQGIDAAGNRHWDRHAIDTSWSQGHSPLWADMDGDGKNELIIGKRYMAHGGADPGEYDPIAIYRYQFDPQRRSWQRWTVSPLGQRVGIGLDPKVADIDRDGDLDLMVSGRSGLYWLQNLGSPTVVETQPTVSYNDHDELLVVIDQNGQSAPVKEPEAWGRRRWHICSAIKTDLGEIPGSHERVPLNVTVVSESDNDSYRTKQVRYQIDHGRQTSATLLVPNEVASGSAAGLVCLFDSKHRDRGQRIAQDLATRGFVCLIPDVVPAGDDHGLRDQIWQSMRAADVLQATDEVYGESIGFVGDARQGQTGLYVSALDQRFIATVSNAKRAQAFTADTESSSHSLSELLASTAPRSLTLVKPDDVTLASDLENAANLARDVFQLRKVPDNLVLLDLTPGEAARVGIYEWLENKMRRRGRSRSPAGGKAEK